MDNAPTVNPWYFRMFSRYTHWYLGRYFHAIRRYEPAEVPQSVEGPLIFYLNHPSWWDPLICLELINLYWTDYTNYAPIEQDQLEKYSIFKKLGFFGVERESPAGGRTFLRVALEVLQEPGNALWITPQGQFADARKRPLNFEAGLGKLAARHRSATLIPLALTYSFWEHQYPEVLVGFGDPVSVDDQDAGGDRWTALLESRLLSVLDPLLEADQDRAEEQFLTILDAAPDAGRVKTTWQFMRNMLFGPPAHSNRSGGGQS